MENRGRRSTLAAAGQRAKLLKDRKVLATGREGNRTLLRRPAGGPVGGRIMTGVDRTASEQTAPGLDELRATAKGWQTIQLALLGFIGICGILKGSGAAAGPRWLHITAFVLILAALVIACYATFLVGRAAWPISLAGQKRPAGSPADGDDELRRAGHSLRTGIRLTFAALILAALAATSLWWPSKQATTAALASSTTATGRTHPETTYVGAFTLTDPDAAGATGPTIAAFETVRVSCKARGAREEGDTSWYRIASAPWNGGYYAAAFFFYNNGQTSGSSSGTPLVDASVPNC
jgi:hypothetical protein